LPKKKTNGEKETQLQSTEAPVDSFNTNRSDAMNIEAKPGNSSRGRVMLSKTGQKFWKLLRGRTILSDAEKEKIWRILKDPSFDELREPRDHGRLWFKASGAMQ